MDTLCFETHPDAYKHWQLSFDGDVATLTMHVSEENGLKPGYVLKLNSYDLGVDIELADAVNRLRFEHPEVKTVVVTSAIDRVFCAGANIPMLSSSTHAWKVNFCKYTNETRLSIEDASTHSGQKYLAALNGVTAGGGYELALACDEILLIDDGNSAVSLPEVPLLGVLPGTGGLTRLVDKRKVRRDLADVFCTVAEGVKGRRAVKWNLVDALAPRSKFADKTAKMAKALADKVEDLPKGPGIKLSPLSRTVSENGASYEFVSYEVNAEDRVATLTITGPKDEGPGSAEEVQAAGENQWSLQAFRELDDAILHLRFSYPEIGLVLLKTKGTSDTLLAADKHLYGQKDSWLAREIVALRSRVIRRLETSAKSFYAVADLDSCFSGCFLELALACDRIYMLNDPDNPVYLAVGEASKGHHLMGHGLTRLQSRFLGDESALNQVLEASDPFDADDANDAGLVTLAPDDLDWDDELRVAIEERASLSPDALTGMEASLRFAGPETCHSKIFGRLSAWQNWIFQRPNAVGKEGALTLYGAPTRPEFDYRRC